MNEKKNEYDDDIDLMELLKIFWKYKTKVFVFVALCLTVTYFTVDLKYPIKKESSCSVLLSFDGIKKHENPDGTRFDVNQILAPAILDSAAKVLNEKKGPQDIDYAGIIKGMIDIEPVIPDKVKSKIRKAENKGEVFFYSPEQYIISLNPERVKNVFEGDNALAPLSDMEMDDILLAVMDEFTKSFEEKYKRETVFSTRMPNGLLDKYDYFEIIDLMKEHSSDLLLSLDEKAKAVGYFKSDDLDFTFIDLISDVKVLNTIQLTRAEALIKSLCITKDKKLYLKVMEQRIDELVMKMNKKRVESEAASNLLKSLYLTHLQFPNLKYSGVSSKDTSKVMMSKPVIDQFVKNNPLNSLVKKTLDSEIEAGRLGVELEQFRNSNEKVKLLKNTKVSEETLDYLVTLLGEIKDSLELYSKKARQLNEAYMGQKIHGTIKLLKQPESMEYRELNMKFALIVSGLVSSFIGLFFVFIMEFVRSGGKSPMFQHPSKKH